MWDFILLFYTYLNYINFTSHGGFNPASDSKVVALYFRFNVDFLYLLGEDKNPFYHYNSILSMNVDPICKKGFLSELLNYIIWYFDYQWNLVQVSSVNFIIKIKWIILFLAGLIKIIHFIFIKPAKVLPSNNAWYNENYVTLL